MSSPAQKYSGMENDRGDDAPKLSKSQKKRRKQMLKRKLSSLQNDPNTDVGITATVDQKRTVSTPAATGSSGTITVDVVNGSTREEQLKITSEVKGSSRYLSLDVKPSSKREEHIENGGGEMGCSSSIKARDAKCAESKRESGTATFDANTWSKREEHMVIDSNEKVSGKIATSDAKIVLKVEEHTKVAIGEMGSSMTTNLNEEGIVDNTASKKRKRRKSKNKNQNQASGDILSTRESTQNMIIEKKGSGTPNVLEAMSGEMVSGKTETPDPTMGSKGEKHIKITNEVKGSSRNSSLDVKPSSKREEQIENGGGEMGCSSSTKTRDAKSAESNRESGPKVIDANTGSKREEHIIASNETVSGKIANSDAKIVSKGEELTKVAIGEMGSSMTTNLNEEGRVNNTASKKRKRQKLKNKNQNQASVDILSTHESTQNMIIDKKGSNTTNVLEAMSGEMVSGKIASSDAKIVSNGEEHTKVSIGEMGSNMTTNLSEQGRVDNTVSNKRKRQKLKNKNQNQASGDILSTHESTQNMVVDKKGLGTTNVLDAMSGEMVLGKTETPTGSKREEHMIITSNETVSGKIATSDVKIVSKGEEHTKVAIGEMGSSMTTNLNEEGIPDNTASKKRERQKSKNKNQNQASGDVLSTHESTQNMVIDKKGSSTTNVLEAMSGEMVSGKTETPDSTMVSKGETHIKASNDKMGSSETTNLTVDSTVKNKKKRKSRNMRPTLGEILNPQYLQNLETANVEMVTGTTATDNTTSKKRKRQKLKNNNPAAGDILSTGESIQDSVIAKKDSGTNKDLEAVNTESKREDYPKFVNGEKCSSTIADAESTMLNRIGCTEVANTEMDSSRTTTIVVNTGSNGTSTHDVKTVSKRKEHTKTVYGETSSKIITTHDAKSTVFKVEECTKVSNVETGSSATTALNMKRKEPILGDILNPKYHENLEIAEMSPAISKRMKRKMCKERKRLEKGVDLNSHEKTKVIEITPDPTLGKKLLIFDVNGLLADIVSPRPKNIKADKYIPKRAIFKRPFLDDFLYFCFEKFNVGIWSSRTKKYLDPVVDFLLGDLKKKLVLLWDASNCSNSRMRSLEDKHKCIVFKDLRKIWEKDGPNNLWVKGTFNDSNTLLLDDSPYKALLNPKHTGIFPATYSYTNTNDDFLGPNGELRKYLEGLAASDDMKTYVEQHPFGQGAINELHPNWAFYWRVKKSQR